MSVGRALVVGETFTCSSPTLGTSPSYRSHPGPRAPSHCSALVCSTEFYSWNLWSHCVYLNLTPRSSHRSPSPSTILQLLVSTLRFPAIMDTLTTHPNTAQQATAFTSPASLSFPGGAGDLTPPSDKDGLSGANSTGSVAFGQQQPSKGVTLNADAAGNGVTPNTPAATPGATAAGSGTGVSGIVPTLQ